MQAHFAIGMRAGLRRKEVKDEEAFLCEAESGRHSKCSSLLKERGKAGGVKSPPLLSRAKESVYFEYRLLTILPRSIIFYLSTAAEIHSHRYSGNGCGGTTKGAHFPAHRG